MPPDDQFAEFKKQLDRIELALVGDEAMGHLGIVHRVAKTEQDVSMIQVERKAEADQRKGAFWIASAAATVAGAIGAALTWFGFGPRP